MKKIFIVAMFSFFIYGRLTAQGCSDAGVCTIHSIKNNTTTEQDKDNNDLVIGFAYGKGERDVSNYTPYIEYTRSLSNRTSLTAKASFSWISGELASTSGLSDLFVSVNHAFDTKGKWQTVVVPFEEVIANYHTNWGLRPQGYGVKVWFHGPGAVDADVAFDNLRVVLKKLN